LDKIFGHDWQKCQKVQIPWIKEFQYRNDIFSPSWNFKMGATRTRQF
jgi:V8-like Glu-specific endopeptidase